VGYAIGGGLILAVGTRSALWLAVALAIAVGMIDRWGLLARPALASGSVSMRATWRRNRALFGESAVRRLLLAQWIPNGLIVGAEALFVPYAGAHAAWLFAAAGAGMLVGDVIVGRWVTSDTRARLTRPLYVLLAAPYLAFAVHPSLLVAVGVVGLASIGYGGTLGLQQRLVEALPEASLAQAFALASAGMLSAQGIAAYLIGSVAQAVGAPIAMSMAGVASLLATAALLTHRGDERSAAATGPERHRAGRLSVATPCSAADRRSS
jgi:predicted MFS family arabinose efflux permease